MIFDSLSYKKRILITQLLSVLFAFILEIHTRLLIANDWLFSNYAVFYTEVIILIIMFTIFIYLYLDGKWISIVLISIPYIIYWFIILAVSSIIYPSHTDPEDYGVGLLVVFASMCQWISVVIASIIGTYIKRRHNSNRK
jgi:hypothetical protein